MNNICAVRTLKNQFGNDSAQRTLHERPLPHEPTMNESVERWGVAQKEDRLIAVDPRNTFDAVYVCRHCGLLYMDSDEKPKEQG